MFTAMIENSGWCDEARWGGGTWRRAADVLDDYDRGGALTEALADDLVNELAGLGPRSRPGRSRRGPARPGPQPSRPATAPVPTPARPRLTLIHGG